MDKQLTDYLKNKKENTLDIKQRFKPIKQDTLKKMYYLKYINSIVNPGENVGTIAG